MKRVVLLLVLVVSGVWSGVAGEEESERETLKGIESLDVVIEPLNLAEQKTGLTVEQLRTDVELKLRLAGIKVDRTARQFLYVSTLSIFLEDPRYAEGWACRIEVSVRQRVRLERDPLTVLYADTWSASWISTGPTGDYFKERSRKIIGDGVDKFLNAYLSVNPKD